MGSVFTFLLFLKKVSASGVIYFFFLNVSFSIMLGSYYSKFLRRPQTKQNFVPLLITKSYSHDGNIPNKNRKTSNSGEINYITDY